MKRSFEPVVKKQQKQKYKFRAYDEDYLGPKHPQRDNYKRKLKHKNVPVWETDI